MAAAVALHVVVAAIVVQVLTFGHGIPGFLDFGKSKEQKEEQLTYVTPAPKPVAVAPVTKPVVTPPRTVAPPTLTSPSATSNASDEPPRATPPAARADTGSGAGTGTGNGIGAIDPNLRGIKPVYGDPRVWDAPAGNGMPSGRDRAERLDSVIGHAITSARDSLEALARAQGKYGRAPGDWTKTDKDGNKWGWDQTGIRLGKVVIPNALLALLPLNASTAANMSGNFTAMEREKRLGLAREDIMRMSERGQGEAEFRKLATELRDRRERERRDRLKAPSASIAPTAPAAPPNKNN